MIEYLHKTSIPATYVTGRVNCHGVNASAMMSTTSDCLHANTMGDHLSIIVIINGYFFSVPTHKIFIVD